MLGDAAMEAKHLAALSENGDPAAHYFLAREAARSGPEGAQLAVESLLNAPIEVRADWRCSRLLLDLFWQLKTGKRFLSGERNTLAFTETDWNECLRIADAVPTAGDFDRYRLEFLRGISLFHLRSYLSSAEAFRRLDQHSQNLSSRVVSTYLYSDAGGRPSRSPEACAGRPPTAAAGPRGSISSPSRCRSFRSASPSPTSARRETSCRRSTSRSTCVARWPTRSGQFTEWRGRRPMDSELREFDRIRTVLSQYRRMCTGEPIPFPEAPPWPRHSRSEAEFDAVVSAAYKLWRESWKLDVGFLLGQRGGSHEAARAFERLVNSLRTAAQHHDNPAATEARAVWTAAACGARSPPPPRSGRPAAGRS